MKNCEFIIYNRWNNELEHDNEEITLLKTSQKKVRKVMQIIRANHPYDTPAIFTLDMKDIETNYRNWMTERLNA